MSDVFYREYLAACAERDALRAELAAERERKIVPQASLDMLCKEVDEAEARIAKLREALVKARAWIVEGKVDFDDSLADAIDAVLKETGHE
jgi:hypothetical protein